VRQPVEEALQVHAAQHFLARRGQGPACRGSFPAPGTIANFLCPVCGKFIARTEWSEEHTPIQAGTFTMGSAVASVITCAPCNNGPGQSYEKGAAANSASPQLDVDLPGMTTAMHGRRRVQLHKTFPLYVVREELPFVRTDFKAGFLLAFASMGYEWALSAGVRPAAGALDRKAAPPASEHGYLMRSTFTPGFSNVDLVIEVVEPALCIIVRAATGVSVVLPAAGQLRVPRIEAISGPSSFPGRTPPAPAPTSTRSTATDTCLTLISAPSPTTWAGSGSRRPRTKRRSSRRTGPSSRLRWKPHTPNRCSPPVPTKVRPKRHNRGRRAYSPRQAAASACTIMGSSSCGHCAPA
jgi:hypothetical protein